VATDLLFVGGAMTLSLDIKRIRDLPLKPDRVKAE
jgi:hypothetical protein